MATLAGKDTTGTLITAEGEIELLDRRTRTAKVFHLGGRRYRIGASLGPIHYRRDPFDEREELKEIDLSLDPTPGEEWDFACETNGYQVRIWNSREVGGRTLRCVAQFRRAGRWLAMAPVALAWENEAGERQLIAKPNPAVSPRIDNDASTATWADCFGPGIDFAYNLRPDRFYKTLIVRTAAAVPRPTIGTSGLRLVLVMALAWDAVPANGFAAERPPVEVSDDLTGIDTPDELTQDVDFSFRDAGRDVWWLRRPTAWDSTKEEPRTIEVEWSLRRVGDRAFATFAVPATALSKATYPVYIDTSISEEQTTENDDDTGSRGTTYPGYDTYYAYGSIRVGRTTTQWATGGFRFTTVPIPAGVTISSAVLSFSAAGTSAADIQVRIAAEDVDSAAIMSITHMSGGTAYDARTTANVFWDPADWTQYVWYDSPDVAAVVQEVVGRPGWALNNNLLFIMYETRTTLPASNTYRLIEDIATSGNGAKFNCTYSEPVSGGDWLFASD